MEREARRVASMLLFGLAAYVASVVPLASPVSAQQNGPGQVREDLIAYVRANVDTPAATIEMPPLAAFDIDRQRFSGALRTEMRSRSETPFMGRVPVTVTLFADEIQVKRAIVSPYVRVTDQVVVPKRNLRRGDVLSKDDLGYAERDRSVLPDDVLRDVEGAVGLRLKRTIGRDKVIRRSQLEGVPVVERGDRVMVVLQAGALRIQSIGRAQESGAVGEWIRVLNLDSKRELSGRLDSEGRVHVSF